MCCLIFFFVETKIHFFQDSFMNRKFKNSIYLKYKCFCNIINVFAVNFDLFNKFIKVLNNIISYK